MIADRRLRAQVSKRAYRGVASDRALHEHAVFRLNDVSHLTQGKGFGVFEFKYEK